VPPVKLAGERRVSLQPVPAGLLGEAPEEWRSPKASRSFEARSYIAPVAHERETPHSVGLL